MSRSRLSLFSVDRRALEAFAGELRAALSSDDRRALAELLGLADRAAFSAARHGVDVLLAPESYPPSAALFAGVRAAAVGRALRLSWTSGSLALEGRLRGFEPLRDDPELASKADALLDGVGVPWFLRRPGGTSGVLASEAREALAGGLAALDDPPVEIEAFAEALEALPGDVLCHDGLT